MFQQKVSKERALNISLDEYILECGITVPREYQRRGGKIGNYIECIDTDSTEAIRSIEEKFDNLSINDKKLDLSIDNKKLDLSINKKNVDLRKLINSMKSPNQQSKDQSFKKFASDLTPNISFKLQCKNQNWQRNFRSYGKRKVKSNFKYTYSPYWITNNSNNGYFTSNNKNNRFDKTASGRVVKHPSIQNNNHSKPTVMQCIVPWDFVTEEQVNSNNSKEPSRFVGKLLDLLNDPTNNKPKFDMYIQRKVNLIQNKKMVFKCPGGVIISSDSRGNNNIIITPHTTSIYLNNRFS